MELSISRLPLPIWDGWMILELNINLILASFCQSSSQSKIPSAMKMLAIKVAVRFDLLNFLGQVFFMYWLAENTALFHHGDEGYFNK